MLVGISTENSYFVRLLVTDSGGSTYSADILIPSQLFPIDVRAGGKGVAFGKTAETDNLFDVNYQAKFRKRVDIDTELYVAGMKIDLGYDVVDTW